MQSFLSTKTLCLLALTFARVNAKPVQDDNLGIPRQYSAAPPPCEGYVTVTKTKTKYETKTKYVTKTAPITKYVTMTKVISAFITTTGTATETTTTTTTATATSNVASTCPSPAVGNGDFELGADVSENGDFPLAYWTSSLDGGTITAVKDPNLAFKGSAFARATFLAPGSSYKSVTIVQDVDICRYTPYTVSLHARQGGVSADGDCSVTICFTGPGGCDTINLSSSTDWQTVTSTFTGSTDPDPQQLLIEIDCQDPASKSVTVDIDEVSIVLY